MDLLRRLCNVRINVVIIGWMELCYFYISYGPSLRFGQYTGPGLARAGLGPVMWFHDFLIIICLWVPWLITVEKKKEKKKIEQIL